MSSFQATVKFIVDTNVTVCFCWKFGHYNPSIKTMTLLLTPPILCVCDFLSRCEGIFNLKSTKNDRLANIFAFNRRLLKVAEGNIFLNFFSFNFLSQTEILILTVEQTNALNS